MHYIHEFIADLIIDYTPLNCCPDDAFGRTIEIYIRQHKLV